MLPDVNFLLAALLAGSFAAALLLLAVAIRGSVPVPGRPPSRLVTLARRLRSPAVGLRIAVAAVAAATALLVTRWPVAAIAVAALVLAWPSLFGGQRTEQAQTNRLEALVVWTESLRDVMSGHASLEQGIPATVPNAPVVLRPALNQLVGQLRAQVPMDRALLGFAAALDDPSADLVIASLILSARRRGDRLVDVLTDLSVTAREELDMRRKVTAGRAEIRRGVRILVGLTVGFGVFLSVFGGAYVAPYGTVVGQLVLAVVCGIFAFAFAWMRRLAGTEPVQPFLARPDHETDTAEVALVSSLTGLSTQASTALTTISTPNRPAPRRRVP